MSKDIKSLVAMMKAQQEDLIAIRAQLKIEKGDSSEQESKKVVRLYKSSMTGIIEEDDKEVSGESDSISDEYTFKNRQARKEQSLSTTDVTTKFFSPGILSKDFP